MNHVSNNRRQRMQESSQRTLHPQRHTGMPELPDIIRKHDTTESI